MLKVLKQFTITDFSIEPLGDGLINSTWLVHSDHKKFVLQKINTTVFTTPENIAFNIDLLSTFLQKYHPTYLFIAPLKTTTGKTMVKEEDGYYRLFNFVPNSHTIDVVNTPQQAFEAAKQFARFSKLLVQVDVGVLKNTLPNFHNLNLRLQQFKAAIKNGNAKRIEESKELIAYLISQKSIATIFENRKSGFKIRVTHHDTKISNVLFNVDENGLCIIDLDTVMPGYFISDVGDMMRTYLSPVSEEESDFSKIEIRLNFYNAITEGYLTQMGEELTAKEKKSFHFAGRYMIYMQALRFLTDYLNDDVYYTCAYPTHNLVRAGNQATLLQKFNLIK